MKNYFSRDSAILLLILIVLYKLGDAYAGALTTPFLIRGIGFSVGEVGTINKGLGFASLIVGAIFGGTLMVKLKLFRSLLVFGILQAISNLSFMVLAWFGKSYTLLIFTVAFENVAGEHGNISFCFSPDGYVQSPLYSNTICPFIITRYNRPHLYLTYIRVPC